MSYPTSLSIVVGCRNDNHGGTMLQRLQHFIDCLADQSAARTDVELVIVEWNPPENRQRLKDVLDWTGLREGFSVQILEVPAVLHETFPFSDKLPFFQYLAKNVGIRRARGKFVLSTNIDILLSQELFEFITSPHLDQNTLYRADRVDVEADVPTTKSSREKLQYCAQHTLRAFRPWGLVEGDKHWNSPEGYQSENLEFTLARPWKGQFFFGVFKEMIKEFAKKLVRLCGVVFESGFFKRPHVWREMYYHWIACSAIHQALFSFRKYPKTHSGASGDFILASKKVWETLGGHCEAPLHPMYLDGLTLYQTFYYGIDLKNIPSSKPAFHIEHEGGWTPQTSGSYFTRLRERRIPFLAKSSYAYYAEKLFRRRSPGGILKRVPTWGLSDMDLKTVWIEPKLKSESAMTPTRF